MQKEIRLPAYFELIYCMECTCIHWMEKTERGGEICHGEDFHPITSHPNYYARRLGKGFMLEIKRQALPLEWQILAERPKVLDEVDF